MASLGKHPVGHRVFTLLGMCASEMAKLDLATLEFINLLLFKKDGSEEAMRVFDGIQISTIQKNTISSIYDVTVKEHKKYDSIFYDLNKSLSTLIRARNTILHAIWDLDISTDEVFSFEKNRVSKKKSVRKSIKLDRHQADSEVLKSFIEDARAMRLVFKKLGKALVRENLIK